MLSSSRPVGAAFPVFTAGRLLHYMFRGLLSVHSRYGLHARQVTRCDPFHRSTSTTLLPPPSLRLLPAERPVAGRDLHPLKIDALHGIRENEKLLFREPKVGLNRGEKCPKSLNAMILWKLLKLTGRGTATREQSDGFLVAFIFVASYTTPE
jgi:hypothetical protein